MQNLEKLELGGLEYQIESLLKNLKLLKTENNTLKQRLSHLQQEVEDLNQRNNQAADKIDQVIAQLKEGIA